MPWPVMIIDRDLVICFYNQLAVQLLGATKPMPGTKLDQLIHDQAILQLVQESMQTGRTRRGEHVKDNAGTAWKVSVTPLEHTPDQRAGPRPARTGVMNHAPTVDDGTPCAEHS